MKRKFINSIELFHKTSFNISPFTINGFLSGFMKLNSKTGLLNFFIYFFYLKILQKMSDSYDTHTDTMKIQHAIKTRLQYCFENYSPAILFRKAVLRH